MSDDETHLTHDGLWIPMDLREFTGQVVFRTPRATIQHFQRDGGQLDGYYGTIDESHFGPAEDLPDPRNPDLAPDKVSIKPQGEDATVLTVENVGEAPDCPECGRCLVRDGTSTWACYACAERYEAEDLEEVVDAA